MPGAWAVGTSGEVALHVKDLSSELSLVHAMELRQWHIQLVGCSGMLF